MAVTVIAASQGRSLANPQEGVRGSQKGNEDTAVAPGAAASPGEGGGQEGQRHWDEGSGASWDSRETPQSTMNLLLGTVLLLLGLPGEWWVRGMWGPPAWGGHELGQAGFPMGKCRPKDRGGVSP